MAEEAQRILVIDDDPTIRNAFALALEDTPYEVTTCEDGHAGIRTFEDHHFDLVYLDLKMPGLDGVETLKKIRRSDMHVPIYIVTAYYGDFSDQLEQLRQDNLNFEVMIKPLGGDQIVEITRGILEGPRIVDEP